MSKKQGKTLERMSNTIEFSNTQYAKLSPLFCLTIDNTEKSKKKKIKNKTG